MHAARAAQQNRKVTEPRPQGSGVFLDKPRTARFLKALLPPLLDRHLLRTVAFTLQFRATSFETI